MIEMKTKYGFHDFSRNLAVVKKFNNLNRLNDKQMVYDDLVKSYELIPQEKVISQEKVKKGFKIG